MGIIDRAKPVDEYPEFFKAVIYGRAGNRKATFASTAPNPFWIDLERSTDTLRHIGKGNIPVLRPKNMAEVLGAVKEFAKSQYETLVVDTATRLQLFQLSEHMVNVNAATPARDRYLPYQADYRRSGALLDDMFSTLQDMEKHVIIIAHEKILYNEELPDKPIIAIIPDSTPRLREGMSGLFNVVAYSELKPGIGTKPATQIMYFNPKGKIFAKNRLNIQEPVENPTFTNVFTERT